jgi:hypothetical protein
MTPGNLTLMSVPQRAALLATGLMIVQGAAFADVAAPVSTAKGWPAWLVVLITFVAFIVLIVRLSRVVKKSSGNDKDGPDIFPT